MVRSLSQSASDSACPCLSPLASFYREEFLKHLDLLRQQRGCFSERAVASAEQALDRILGQLDTLCRRENADEVCSRLLASFDCVTGASRHPDRPHTH